MTDKSLPDRPLTWPVAFLAAVRCITEVAGGCYVLTLFVKACT